MGRAYVCVWDEWGRLGAGMCGGVCVGRAGRGGVCGASAGGHRREVVSRKREEA